MLLDVNADPVAWANLNVEALEGLFRYDDAFNEPLTPSVSMSWRGCKWL